MEFGRLITAMVTPFDSNLAVDWKQTEKLIDHLIEDQKTDALVVCGSTGEASTLKDDEKIRLYETAVKVADGRCKIIAGTGSNETDHSLDMTRAAEKAGADGVLIVTPYYNKPSQEGIYRHFKEVAGVTDLPVMAYNIPSRTVVGISTETMLRLAEIPNIVATKESHSDLDHISTLVRNAPEGFRVYCGDDSLTLPYLSVGAYGTVSVASHVIGQPMQEMITAFVNGEVRHATELHHKLFPIFKGLFIAPNPAPIKYALQLKGLDTGGVRLPLVEVTEAEGRHIASLF
ncbi:4-hydroxy-tetrahydrodipicolinate synthase [Gorillibacterium massiliense]|uniref:4-hydroxy-tetrahydrodipicolinate synthase n=1 Tax=Gorillibacterium massiliense TaxID=1280390 RepID=UPI0004AEFFA0|nr:4-hydroxy-tetrahydrodipicolinate synthase [Gorillibacterium massiliense]